MLVVTGKLSANFDLIIRLYEFLVPSMLNLANIIVKSQNELVFQSVGRNYIIEIISFLS